MAMLASQALLHENQKIQQQNVIYAGEHWTWDLNHLDLKLSFRSYWGMCYLDI